MVRGGASSLGAAVAAPPGSAERRVDPGQRGVERRRRRSSRTATTMSLGVASAGTSKPIPVSTSTLSARRHRDLRGGDARRRPGPSGSPGAGSPSRRTRRGGARRGVSSCGHPLQARRARGGAPSSSPRPGRVADRAPALRARGSSSAVPSAASQAANSGITSPCIAQSSSVADSSVVVGASVRTAVVDLRRRDPGGPVHREPAAQHVVAVRRQAVAAPDQAGHLGGRSRGSSSARPRTARRPRTSRRQPRHRGRRPAGRPPAARRRGAGRRRARDAPTTSGSRSSDAPQRAGHRGGPGADHARRSGRRRRRRPRPGRGAAPAPARRARRQQVCGHTRGRAHRDHRTDASRGRPRHLPPGNRSGHSHSGPHEGVS